MQTTDSALNKNVRLFPYYKAAASVAPHLAVFFLFFNERVSLADAVLLGSAYYFAVFVVEVPSGYVSDRYGRRLTLLLASAIGVLACILFLIGNSFFVLCIAQALLASAMAFQSGSDSALLYDSLKNLGREDEYTEHETISHKWSMTALAVSCLVGGALGMIDLRLAYLVTLIAGLVSIALCMKFEEPRTEGESVSDSFFTQIKITLRFFSHPLLAWILCFFIAGFALEHIPFEFYQPYLKLLGQSDLTSWLSSSSTPLISGIIISISMFGGAFGAAICQKLIKRVGLKTLLLASILIQLIIVAGLSLVLHPMMLMLVMFRNFSMSMARGPMLGAIAPHVSSAQRATFLSFLSLCGRASFGVILAMLSKFVVGTDALNWEALSYVLTISAMVGVTILFGLYVWSRRIAHEF